MRMSDWSSDVCSSDLRTSPPLARSSPDNIAISDDLPDPDGPRIARLSPFGMERSTPLNICVGASRVPSERVTLRASIAIWAREDEPCIGERNPMKAGKRTIYVGAESGRAHVRTTVTNAKLVCRLLLEKNNSIYKP